MKRFIIFFLISVSGKLFAQSSPPDTIRFPVELKPTTSFTVQNAYLTDKGIYKVDALWVLKDSQLRNFVKIAEKQKIDSTMASILEQQIKILKQIRTEKDSVIALNKEGYIHYRDLWEETDRKLEEEEIKSARNFRWGFYVGVGVSVLTITAFKLIAD